MLPSYIETTDEPVLDFTVIMYREMKCSFTQSNCVHEHKVILVILNKRIRFYKFNTVTLNVFLDILND